MTLTAFNITDRDIKVSWFTTHFTTLIFYEPKHHTYLRFHRSCATELSRRFNTSKASQCLRDWHQDTCGTRKHCGATTWRPCWMTGTIKLIRILLLMVIQHGGDDVSCKPRIVNNRVFFSRFMVFNDNIWNIPCRMLISCIYCYAGP